MTVDHDHGSQLAGSASHRSDLYSFVEARLPNALGQTLALEGVFVEYEDGGQLRALNEDTPMKPWYFPNSVGEGSV